MSKKAQSNLMLLICAIIWGSAFVAQKAGTVLEPFTYNGIRNIIGGLFLIPVYLILQKVLPGPTQTQEERAASDRVALVGGILCGLLLGTASTLQQFGLFFDTDAGKAGFITTLYIVIVPLLGLFIGKKVRPIIWFCVLMGATGFYLLTMAGKSGGFSLQAGDFFVLLCAVIFSLHILVVDHFAPRTNGVKLSCVQFLTAGIGCCLCMFLFESPSLTAILDCWGPILYCGVLSSGVAYTLQILGQQHAEPTAASLILSLESVFAVLCGVLLLGESMTLVEGLGCVVIFAAVILAQLPSKEERLAAKN